MRSDGVGADVEAEQCRRSRHWSDDEGASGGESCRTITHQVERSDLSIWTLQALAPAPGQVKTCSMQCARRAGWLTKARWLPCYPYALQCTKAYELVLEVAF